LIRTCLAGALCLLAASGVPGASAPNPSTAAPAATPTAAGAASLLGEAGVDAAAVQLPPETLNPEIDLNELEIRLVPMTRFELATLAARWQGIVKQKSKEIVAAQIAVARADGVGVEQERKRLARLAGERAGSWWIGFCWYWMAWKRRARRKR
jgi:small conductance mechanosensitive channel